MADYRDRPPREIPVRIEVIDNQIEPALKLLKRAMLDGGMFKEMKRREF